MTRPQQETFAKGTEVGRGLFRLRLAIWYAMAVSGAVAIFLIIGASRASIAPSTTGLSKAKGAGTIEDTPHAITDILVALTAVLVAGRLLGRVFRYIGQPPVIAEVVAGILLGPSFLGQVWPEAAAFILPHSVAPFLGVIAQLGVVLYMFLVGLEFDSSVFRQRAYATLIIAQAGMVAPFVLGGAMARVLYPRLSGIDVPFISFALFVGVATSITAFPVLARILTDRGMLKTPLGTLALGCAATADVSAWCLLALVIGVFQAQVAHAFVVIGLACAFIAFMVLVVRPMAASAWLRFEDGSLSHGLMAAILVALFLSSMATDWIGIHAIFGAFLLGAVIPHNSTVAHAFVRRVVDFVTVLLLPAFFAYTGMRTQIGLLSGLGPWLLCGFIILVATAGKFGGTLASARFVGLGWRDSASLGILMNTRGLMELIVLTIGLDLKVISPTLFAMMVLMALATTMATSPLLYLIQLRKAEIAFVKTSGPMLHPDEWRTPIP